MPLIDELFYELELRDKGFNKATRDAIKRFRKMEVQSGTLASSFTRSRESLNRFGRATGRIARRAALAIGAITAAAAALGAALLKVATDVQETGNRFEAVFGPQAGVLLERLDDFRRLAGLTTTELKELAATTGDVLTGFGFTQKAAADLSEQILRTAGDLSSFNNVPVAETIDAITTALAGENERLKRYGIVLREAQKQQIAFEQTGKDSAAALTLQDKATATLIAIQRQMVSSTGDLERTQDDMANRLRRSAARLREMRDAVAVLLTPAFEDLVGVLETQVGPAIENVVTILEGEVTTVKEASFAFGRVIGSSIAIGINEALAAGLRDLPRIFLRLIPGDFAERLPLPTDLAVKLLESSAADAREILERSLTELQALARQAEAEAARRRRLVGERPAVGGAADVDAGPAAAEAAAEVEALQEEVDQVVRGVLGEAADATVVEIRELRQKIRDELGQVPDDMAEALDRAEEAALEALGLKEIEDEIDAFRQRLEDRLLIADTIEDEVEAEEFRKAAIEDNIAALKAFRDEQDAIGRDTKAITREILRQKAALQGVPDEEERAAEAAEDRRDAILETAQEIRQATDGVAELASAFGLVDDEIADSIQSLGRLGEGVASIIANLQTGNISGIISGGLGVLGGFAGLIGNRDSPVVQALERNEAALIELRRSVDELTLDLRGGDFARAVQLMDAIFREGDIGLAFSPSAIFERFGLTLGDLNEIAEEFGITLLDAQGRLIPAALEQLDEALESVRESVFRFGDALEDQLRRIRLEFELFDIEDTTKQFEFLRNRLRDLTAEGKGIPAFAGLFQQDISTAEGRRRAESIIEGLAADLLAGRISPQAFGVATFEEAIEILREMERLLDSIEDDAADQAGETQDVRRNVQITAIQGTQLLGFLGSIATRADQQLNVQREIRDLVRRGFEPLAPPPVPGGNGATTTEVNVPVTIENVTVGAGATKEQAAVVTDEMVRRLNRELGLRLKDALR